MRALTRSVSDASRHFVGRLVGLMHGTPAVVAPCGTACAGVATRAAEPQDPFLLDPERLWTRVLRRQGGQLAMLATMPAQPELN